MIFSTTSFRFTTTFASLLLVLLLSITASHHLHSQTPTISIGGGVERGNARLEFLTSADSLYYNRVFEKGINLPTAFAEVAIPVSNSWVSAMAARVSWYGSGITFSTPLPDIPILIPGQVDLNLIKNQEEISFSMQVVQLELLGRFAITDRLTLVAGPTIGYRSIAEYRHLQRFDLLHLPRDLILNPYPFADDGSNLQQNHLALGALFIAEYDIPLSGKLSLVPELRLRSDFISPLADSKWSVLSGGAALSLRYAL